MIDKKSDVTHPRVSRQTWVQTERASHEEWGRLTIKSPRAAALMHHLVAHMDQNAALVASHAALGQLTGMSPSTVKRAISDLKEGAWIEVLQIGGKGGALAFVVNSRVGWADSRKKLPMAAFTARVLAVGSEQEPGYLDGPKLRRIPTLLPGERQLPTGPGLEPPSQPSLGGLEPDLPSLQAELEARGQQRLTLDDEAS